MGKKRKLPSGMWDRNGTYWARFSVNGQVVRKSLGKDYAIACELLAELLAKAYRGKHGLIESDCEWQVVRDAFIRWAKQQRRPRTAEGYEASLAKLEAWQPIARVSEITHEFVFGYREARLTDPEEHVCPRTVNKDVGTLVNCLNKAVLWKKIRANPIAGIPPLAHDSPRKQRRSLSVEEIAAIFQHSPERLRPVWRFFMATGCRLSDTASLLFSQINFEAGTVRITKEDKGHKGREIPLHPAVLCDLTELRDAAPARQIVPSRNAKLFASRVRRFSRDHVFVTQGNTPWDNQLLRRLYSVCRKAGIKDAVRFGAIDLHALRVTFTTLAIEGGASPKAIQEILGHSTLQLTMSTYAKARDTAKRKAVDSLPDVFAHEKRTHPETSPQVQPGKPDTAQ